MVDKNYIEVAEDFREVLVSDVLIGPALAVRLTTIAIDFAKSNPDVSRNEVNGIIIGASAMYRAITGRMY